MNVTNFTCRAVETSYGIPDFHASTLTFSFGVLQVLASFFIVIYLYCHGYCSCNKSDEISARGRMDSLSSTRRSHESFVESTIAHKNTQLVLPIYTLCLWGVALADLFQGIFNVLFPIKQSGGNFLWPTSIVFGFCYGCYHFVLEGIAFLLAQQGVGRFSLRRSFFGATLWAFITFFIQVVAFTMEPNTKIHFAATLAWESMMFLLYFILAFWPIRWFPERCCHRRPALRTIYAPFWALLRCISCTAIILQMYNIDMGICVYDFGVLLPFAIIKPFIVYITLRSDSRYWMGLGDQNHPLQRPLMGSNLGASSARELASQLDTSTTRGVRMLHPSLLELENSGSNTILGIGGSARVIRATYQGRPVAAKLLFLPELTPNHVRSLCNEASLLSSVQSDHVLRIHGLVVQPPSIFLISDVASHGSLYDLLHNFKSLSHSRSRSRSDKGSKVSRSGIEQFDIHGKKSLLFRLHVAIGCAESVEILHQQCPSVVHGDIKGQNFLLHNDFMVKVADLELASRCLQGVSSIGILRRPVVDDHNSSSSKESSVGDMNDFETSVRIRKINDSRQLSKESLMNLRRLSQSLSPDDPQYRISETFNWLAPEVIDGHRNSPSSDIYSLAMTLYEIMTDKIPFHHLQLSSKFDSEKLKFAICSESIRPGSVNGFNTSNDLNEMDHLLSKMWSKDRSDRPNSSNVVTSLRSIACKILFGELTFTHSGYVNLDGHCNELYNNIEISNVCGAVLDAAPPFRFKYVSKKWQNNVGWSSDKIINKTIFETLRGPRTNRTRTRNLKTALALGEFFVSGCVHYDSDGQPMLHFFSLTPLAGTKPLVLLRSATMLL
jgi:hypothetical protein